MIKVGILGAETLAAGELIRILINHPDVELLTLASDTEAGRRIDAVHRGLIGDTEMEVVNRLDPEGLDIVFLCGEPWMARQWLIEFDAATAEAEICIIDITGAFRNGEFGMVYGLPEFNRKALVRGAKRASVPSAAAMPVELALFPLAKNSLLQGLPILASLTMAYTESPEKVAAHNAATHAPGIGAYSVSTRLDPVAPKEYRPDSEAASDEITACIRSIQPSFNSVVNIALSRNVDVARGVKAIVEVPCSVGLPELNRLFADAYHDHAFTYPIGFIPEIADVANTNKCLIFMEYPGNDDPTAAMSQSPRLRITTVADNLLKGAAGTAVHCMNLLFGLSERTGLALKGSAV